MKVEFNENSAIKLPHNFCEKETRAESMNSEVIKFSKPNMAGDPASSWLGIIGSETFTTLPLPLVKRIVLASVTGVIITFGLLYFMAAIIAPPDHVVRNSQDEMSIEFLRVKRDSESQLKKRQRPKKPKILKTPPREMLKVAQTQTTKMPALKMNMPRLNPKLNLLGGALVGLGLQGGDAQVMPLVRIEPQFPRKAAIKGIEGWVLLSFDITPVGTVANVQVLDSKPRRTFDSAARRALLKWKYKPKMENGRAVNQDGLKVKIAFSLKG